MPNHLLVMESMMAQTPAYCIFLPPSPHVSNSCQTEWKTIKWPLSIHPQQDQSRTNDADVVPESIDSSRCLALEDDESWPFTEASDTEPHVQEVQVEVQQPLAHQRAHQLAQQNQQDENQSQDHQESSSLIPIKLAKPQPRPVKRVRIQSPVLVMETPLRPRPVSSYKASLAISNRSIDADRSRVVIDSPSLSFEGDHGSPDAAQDIGDTSRVIIDSNSSGSSSGSVSGSSSSSDTSSSDEDQDNDQHESQQQQGDPDEQEQEQNVTKGSHSRSTDDPPNRSSTPLPPQPELALPSLPSSSSRASTSTPVTASLQKIGKRKRQTEKSTSTTVQIRPDASVCRFTFFSTSKRKSGDGQGRPSVSRPLILSHSTSNHDPVVAVSAASPSALDISHVRTEPDRHSVVKSDPSISFSFLRPENGTTTVATTTTNNSNNKDTHTNGNNSNNKDTHTNDNSKDTHTNDNSIVTTLSTTTTSTTAATTSATVEPAIPHRSHHHLILDRVRQSHSHPSSHSHSQSRRTSYASSIPLATAHGPAHDSLSSFCSDSNSIGLDSIAPPPTLHFSLATVTPISRILSSPHLFLSASSNPFIGEASRSNTRVNLLVAIREIGPVSMCSLRYPVDTRRTELRGGSSLLSKAILQESTSKTQRVELVVLDGHGQQRFLFRIILWGSLVSCWILPSSSSSSTTTTTLQPGDIVCFSNVILVHSNNNQTKRWIGPGLPPPPPPPHLPPPHVQHSSSVTGEAMLSAHGSQRNQTEIQLCYRSNPVSATDQYHNFDPDIARFDPKSKRILELARLWANSS